MKLHSRVMKAIATWNLQEVSVFSTVWSGISNLGRSLWSWVATSPLLHALKLLMNYQTNRQWVLKTPIQ